MSLDSSTPLCPYCGSRDTSMHSERSHDAIYGCGDCERSFAAPRP